MQAIGALRYSLFLLLSLTLTFNFSAASAKKADPFNHNIDPNTEWAYDAGPDLSTAEGQELVDLIARYPHMPEVSQQVMGAQKFRPHFGPTFWRMRHQKNNAKILFIGQDATHIAEASKRTATAGFGGRAQDLAVYLGVDEGAAFMNVYQNTIKGQYGTFDSPYVVKDKNGRPSLRLGSFVDNKLWLMTHGLESPMVEWRHQFLDWFLRTNRDLKLIVLFGGAARDAAGTFIEAKGGRVGARMSEDAFREVRIPMMKEKFAGANNTFPAVLNKTNGDLAEQLLGRRLDYTKLEDQKAAQEIFKSRLQDFLDQALFSENGPYANGLIHPAQLGGYDLNKIEINGVKTISLKGLPLSDGTQVGDVLVVQFPHPSALSRMTKEQASETMQKALAGLAPYVKNGWRIQPDEGMKSSFADGKPYVYSRKDIGPEYYDFGTPKTRMLPVSLASRAGADVIVFGTRERARFDKALLAEMAKAQPNEAIDPAEIFTTQPRTPKTRGLFDRGPGELFAKIMKTTIDLEAVFTAKKGMSFAKNGIDALNVKNHPDVADFGHYRGTFKKPKIVVLADPHGADDLLTSRALTGARGQYLQGFLNASGADGDYLIIKTVPFIMDGATDAEWSQVLEQTAEYRRQIFAALFELGTPDVIIADGAQAAKALKALEIPKSIQKIEVARDSMAPDAGLKKAAEQMAEKTKLRWSGEAANIPREDLPYGAKVWEGTSGDSVIGATDIKNKGLAFAVVVPQWAHEQKVKLDARSQKGVQKLLARLKASSCEAALVKAN